MFEMVDKLLTQQEILEVQREAEASWELRDENCINLFGSARTTILNISRSHGVIIIKGAEHTGFEHILQRHNYFSEKTYWEQGSQGKKFSYPGKFAPSTIPILDYALIADGLYRQEFKSLINNKNPDQFDLYEGIPDVEVAESRKYRMLLYKDTKILHTLFPTNKKHIVKKELDHVFDRGEILVEDDFPDGSVRITVPFNDYAGILRYSFILIKDYRNKRETGKIIIHRSGKQNLKLDWSREMNEQKAFVQVIKHNADFDSLVQSVENELSSIENDRENWEVID